ncbi:MAG: hypothetical protein A3E16_04585 [Candidatus Blackburnbacteria bacterium RIFCSPHIGHO2_12_FULL_44_25]|nr:MAG: hypothetical protein A3E16_04585 [Candidatus Blackburnbacteria bacterium RIFCSPHIGHO2_12_FULL_44_25]
MSLVELAPARAQALQFPALASQGQTLQEPPSAEPTHIHLTPKQEAELTARAQAGDEEAIQILFSKYQVPIRRHVCRLLGDPEEAKDFSQDIFLKAYLALSKTFEDTNFRGWLYKIATNTCREELRRRKRTQERLQLQPWEESLPAFHPSQVAKDNPEHDAVSSENKGEILSVLEKLGPRYRMLLILRYYNDLSYDEIAEIVGKSVNAVKFLLFRAREEFRNVCKRTGTRPGQILD